MDKKNKSWSDLNQKEKSTVKGVVGAGIFVLLIEYWKTSTPKQKFNIVFFWISQLLIQLVVLDHFLNFRQENY